MNNKPSKKMNRVSKETMQTQINDMSLDKIKDLVNQFEIDSLDIEAFDACCEILRIYLIEQKAKCSSANLDSDSDSDDEAVKVNDITVSNDDDDVPLAVEVDKPKKRTTPKNT